jgi:prepilin-type N-terminal cleavage/methylation domain-containing protein
MVWTMTRIDERQEGFTLLEIMVAIVLISVLTLMAAMALRMTMAAWERGEREGEGVQLRAMLPSILETQLQYLVKTASFSPTGREIPLPFYGSEHSLAFFTSYAPMGSPLQGLLEVSYVFMKRDKTLLFYQRVITNQEDFEDSVGSLTGNGSKDIQPMSTIRGIAAFDLLYGSGNTIDFEKMGQWKEAWNPEHSIPPTYVRIEFAEGEKEKPRRWFFAVGK